MAEKGPSPYAFSIELETILNRLKTEEMCDDLWVLTNFKELYGVRNSVGQTFLYCLLRFTKSQLYRKNFLFSATADQLAMQNTNCGSTAIAGYFWGEIQRFCNHDTIRQQLDELLKQFGVDNFNRFMNIKNNNGESARDHAYVMM
jgi:hypothetical protein